MSASQDHYAELGVERSSSRKDVKKAYLAMARKFHPDLVQGESEKSRAEAKFKRITAAYEILSDHHKRQEYDAYGQGRSPGFEGMGQGYRSTNSYGWARNDPQWNKGPRATPTPDPKMLWRHAKVAMLLSIPAMIGCGIIGWVWDSAWASANRGKKLQFVEEGGGGSAAKPREAAPTRW